MLAPIFYLVIPLPVAIPSSCNTFMLSLLRFSSLSFISARKMTDLTKLLSDSAVTAQQAAEKLAGPCLEAIKKNEDASKIEGEFDGLWSSVLSAAEQTPHDRQDKLVQVMHAIKELSPSGDKAKKFEVWGEEKRWDELPMFGGKAREQLDIGKLRSPTISKTY